MDRPMLNHLQYAVGNFQYQYLLDVVNLVGLQNLDEQNLDVDLTCPDEVHLLHQLDVQVDVELRHQLKMDYFRGAVDVELRHQLRKDYFLGVQLVLVQLGHQLPELLNQLQLRLVAQYYFRRSRALGQP
jgi:hypothetical protein